MILSSFWDHDIQHDGTQNNDTYGLFLRAILCTHMQGVILENVALLNIVLLSVVKLHCRVSFYLMLIANYAIVPIVILQNVTFLKVILPNDTAERCSVTLLCEIFFRALW